MRVKKRSKITPAVSKNSPKESLQAFRADHELTKFLERLPNKTEFITNALRMAIAEIQMVTCPTCDGSGKFLARKDKPTLRLAHG